MPNIIESIILGIVEGLTEFLPVSSTGHLILTSYFLKIPETEQIKAFQIIIQAAAMFAVVLEYRAQFLKWILALFNFKKDSKEIQQIWGLVLGFLPAGFFGLLFGKQIKNFLFGPLPVAIALIVGGIVILLIEKFPTILKMQKADSTEEFPTPAQCLKIGFFQCLALVPGVSRSLATILGGQFSGLSKVNATLFSFYLAVPTLLAASVYDLYKSKDFLMNSAHSDFGLALFFGFLFSFLTAWICIRLFLKLVKKFSFTGFGWYRIALGIVTLFLLL